MRADQVLSAGRTFVVGLAISLVLLLGVFAVAVGTRDAVWTAVAATGETAFILAYQSWFFRRAAIAAEKATQVSADALLESERQRLEAAAPRVVARIGSVGWPPDGARRFVGGPPATLTFDQIFRLPKDKDQRIGLHAEGWIRNEGSHTVRIQLSNIRLPVPVGSQQWPWSDAMGSGAGLAHEIDLKPGEQQAFLVQEERSVAEWIDNALARAEGQPEPHAILASMRADDGQDNGVIDQLDLTLGGAPLVPVEQEDSAWKLPRLILDAQPVWSKLQPAVRTYYRSKKADLVLGARLH